MTQSGPPAGSGQPQQPQQPPPPPPPPPASWQQAPQQPIPPQPTAQPPAWSADLTSSAPVAGPAGFYYADVPNRVIAYIIDVIVLGIIYFVVALVLGGVLGGMQRNFTNDLNLSAFLIVTIVNFAISAFYFASQWSSQRATLGMRVLGLQIGDEKDGQSITMGQGLTRWLLIGIPSILLSFSTYASTGIGPILSLIGLIWLIALLVSTAQSPTKQGFHDRYAHTIMVKAARRAA